MFKEIERDKVLLYEKHDVITNEALKMDDDKTLMIHGAKIFRIVKPVNGDFETIAQYNNDSDSIDLSELNNYIGYHMASVDIDDYNNDNLVWNCVLLGNGSDDNLIFTVTESRKCTLKECELLDEVFPEFYETAVKNYKALLANKK